SPLVGHIQQQIFCDDSFINESIATGYGVVIINPNGQVTYGKAGTILCSSPMVAESKALLVANHDASSGVPSCIKSVCLYLMVALSKPTKKWPWECSAWLHPMKIMLDENPHISISFVPRCLNVVADWVAKAAREGILQNG
ncbi:hypothetical protein LINPERHAP2_LOCUS29957, partial [Linum perenne]